MKQYQLKLLSQDEFVLHIIRSFYRTWSDIFFCCKFHVALRTVLQFYHNDDIVYMNMLNLFILYENYRYSATSCIGNISNQDMYLTCSIKKDNLGAVHK